MEAKTAELEEAKVQVNKMRNEAELLSHEKASLVNLQKARILELEDQAAQLAKASESESAEELSESRKLISHQSMKLLSKDQNIEALTKEIVQLKATLKTFDVRNILIYKLK